MSFNEYTPLFVSDGIRLDAAALAGSDETGAEEVAVTGLYGRTSVSAGQFHYQTDGFRRNYDLEHDISTLFGQVAVTEWLNLQAEYQRRNSHSGDRDIEFDLQDFEDTLHEDIEDNVYRLGAKIEPGYGQNLLLSAIYINRDSGFDREIGDDMQRVDDSADGRQFEAQYIAPVGPHLRIVLGGGAAFVDGDRHDRFVTAEDQEEVTRSRADRRAFDVYAVGTLAPLSNLELTGRLGYDSVEIHRQEKDAADPADNGLSGFTPGLGVAWQPVAGVRVRAAAARQIKGPSVTDQSLAPTQLAGFNQLFDDQDATRSDQYDLSTEFTLNSVYSAGLWARRRNLSRELNAGVDPPLNAQRDDQVGAYLYATPSNRIALSAEIIGERYSRHEKDITAGPLRVSSLLVPLSARYFHPDGWFILARTTFVKQDVDEKLAPVPGRSSQVRTDQDLGTIVDAGIGYRLPNRRGMVSVELRNLLDRRLQFQDESSRSNDEIDNPRFIPERTIFARLSLNF